MNTDPTKSANLDPAIEVAYAQQKFSGDVNVQERAGLILTMPLVQQMGGGWANQYGQFYARNQAYMSVLWEDNYANDVKNIVDAELRSRNTTDQNLNAMARVMKVYVFARLTDLYGDIPYFKASTGFTQTDLAPVFDKQEDIYKDFFNQLDTAMTLFSTGKDNVINDVFYKGDVSKWKKFTSSFRLRLATRIVKRDPAKAQQEIMQAFNDGLMASNDDICMTRHDDNLNDYATYTGNGMSSALRQGGFPGGYRIQNSFINQLKNTNDPRLNVFARNYWDDQPGATWENRIDITDSVRAQVGSFGVGQTEFIWDGWKNTINITNSSVGPIAVGNNLQKLQVSKPLMANSAPFFGLTYAETEFLLADATIRLGLSLGASAEDHYKNGMRAACQQLAFYPGSVPIADAAIDQFIADNAMQPGKELEQINDQLWVNFFLNGPEAYANLRRSGFPTLPSGYRTDGYSDADTKVMPRRLEYPLSEKSLNKTNVDAAVQRMGMGGKDDWNNRVWWDMQ
ncbi:MAG: SusD/RagB family nutrient-binding outer membrane lipoprotein [Bacteroidota bacterium]|nr:SusD/RagB family nutrient-binding outer membrane lipoprotein [Bacteroidota bacterium]